MTYAACQVTHIATQELPELLQFYRYFPQKYPFLLTTSSQKNMQKLSNSFDILFIEPESWLKLDYNLELTASIGINVAKDALFIDVLDQLFLSEKKLSDRDNISLEGVSSPFTGGWFVFLAYELAQQIESCLTLTSDKTALPMAYAARVKKALLYDHTEDCFLFLTEWGVDHQQCYHDLLADIDSIHHQNNNKVDANINKVSFIQQLDEENKQEFVDSVAKVKSYIKEGDVFQVNLSRLWKSQSTVFMQPKSANRTEHIEQATFLSQQLSQENPAPFSGLAYFNSTEGMVSIISSSPERLLKVSNNKLESRPIAGTHPRSLSEQDDQRLLNALHRHPKEQAEHIMLIDLIRNDLGRVCVPGTVKVDELMINESYAHVHHIVSNISGDLQLDKTPGDVIKAMFPGGTITGCPKVRCMEIIAELETQSRGAYTGSMGYINLDGSMDFNILIRTMVLEQQEKNKQISQQLSFRAGAGLVFDSIAKRELYETRVKAKGLLRSLNND
jgi:anthranilate synthase component 1